MGQSFVTKRHNRIPLMLILVSQAYAKLTIILFFKLPYFAIAQFFLST